MSKIFVVNKYSFNYDKRYDIRPVKMFLTKKEAEIWIENNFVLALNTEKRQDAPKRCVVNVPHVRVFIHYQII